MTDFVTIDGLVDAVRDPQLVSYPCAESPEQRKARVDRPPPIVAYTSCHIEKIPLIWEERDL
jgi:hypothetical protein